MSLRPVTLRSRAQRSCAAGLVSIRPKKIARIDVVIPDAVGDLAVLRCRVHLACKLSCTRENQTVSTKSTSCSFLVLETHP